MITLLYELRRRKKKYGLATSCIGGGQGIDMIGGELELTFSPRHSEVTIIAYDSVREADPR